jgi:hypothetical protein
MTPTNENKMTTTQDKTAFAAIYAPGKAIFGADLLDLTATAWAAGVNLSGAEIRTAWSDEGGGVWVEGACENKHYNANGTIEN